MFNKNFLYLLFLFFIKFKFSIFSNITSYTAKELAYTIFSNNDYIFSLEKIYDEQSYSDRLRDIYYDYHLFSYICYIDSIDEENNNFKIFKNNLQYYLSYYFSSQYSYSAFIILIKNKYKVIVFMGDMYFRKFTINEKNNVQDLNDYISNEFSGNKDDIENVFDYIIDQLENALNGDEIEPGTTLSIIITIIIVVIIVIAYIIYRKCIK